MLTEVIIINTHEAVVLILTTVISTIIGGSGIVGIAFYFIRKRMEQKLDSKESEQQKRKAQRIQRIKVEEELQHCEGRLFFWVHKAIVTGQHNGDLEAAFEAYQEAEQAKKDLDREVLAENEYDE
jgi:hypothetical protein